MNTDPSNLTRRDFLSKSLAGAGAGLVLGAPNLLRAASATDPDAIHVALVGFGKQAEVLFAALKNIPGLYFQAVCDISKNKLQYGMGQCRAHQRTAPKGYSDIDEMLATEKGLDVAIIATPDFWHSPHTVKCLEAGLHVYCEKMMAHTIEAAREMVIAMEKSGKLCQIGHQRRSNPRYRFTLDHLINGKKICGQIVNVNGQWNRSLGSSGRIGGEKLHPSAIVPTDVLNRYGFKDMDQYMNWRLYRDLSGGPISDLGAHQIDVFNWFLGTAPKRVFATGGRSYFKDREHFDNVMCLFDYDTPQGEVRAFYQVLTTTSYGVRLLRELPRHRGRHPHLGNPLQFRHLPREHGTQVGRPDRAGISRQQTRAAQTGQDLGRRAILRESAARRLRPARRPAFLPRQQGPACQQAPHQPHLENFFAAVRGKATLNCDARHAFESEAPIFWVNPSALSKQPIEFTAEHLTV